MSRWKARPITTLVESARISKAMRDCPTKIMEPEELIKKALDKWGDKVAVAWSGGRCSTAVLYMALEESPDVRVIFNDTGVEFRETYDFVERIRDEWSLNLIVTNPMRSFWECVDLYGFPMIRGKYYERKNVSKEGKPMCCMFLKEKPLKRAMTEHRIYATMTGMRVCESRMRMFGVCQWGQYHYTSKFRMWRYHPIAFWDTKRLIEYTEENCIPQNEVYEKGRSRCGCWPCTGFLSWREQMRTSHPGMYVKLNRMVKQMEGEPTLWEYETCPEEVLDREEREALMVRTG